MKFELRPFTIVKSVAQRALLKWWGHPTRKGNFPSRTDCQAEELQALWQDMALLEVLHENGRVRFKCLTHGARLRPVDGADLTGLYLDEFFPDSIKQSALTAYEATVTMACPIYTMRNAIDAHQVPVTFERIRMPLGSPGGRIDHLLTHVEIFCEDGRYERENLLHAGLSMRDYTMGAAISMAVVGLSPGAEVLDS